MIWKVTKLRKKMKWVTVHPGFVLFLLNGRGMAVRRPVSAVTLLMALLCLYSEVCS